MVESLRPSIELSSSPLLSEKQDTALAEFGRQLLYAGAGSPLTALAQPVDKILNTDMAGSIQETIKPSEPAQFNTGRYWLQQSANALGTMGSFLLAATVSRGIMRNGMSEQRLATHLAGRGALGLTMSEAAMTGFLHDSVLRPTQSTDQRTLLEARLTSGVTGAALLTLATASTLGMKSLGERAALSNQALAGQSLSLPEKFLANLPEGVRRGVVAPVLRSELATGAATASLAAPLALQADHLLRTNGFASLSDTAAASYTGLMLGGTFGAYQQFKGKYDSGRSNYAWTEGAGQRQFHIKGGEPALSKALSGLDAGAAPVLTVREFQGSGAGLFGRPKLGPEQTLLLQHRVGNGAVDPKAARADLIAACNLEACFAEKAVVPGQTVFLRAGKDRISINSEEPPAIRNGERSPRVLGEKTFSTRAEAAVPAELLKSWTKHNLSLLKSLNKDLAKTAMEDGRMKLAVLDRDFLQTQQMRARDKVRPQTQRELGSADDYDPLLATQPIHIVKMSGPYGPEYHVLNGNNRIYLFGSHSSNPDNLGIPVWLYDSPKTFMDLYKYDVTSTANRATRFNFD